MRSRIASLDVVATLFRVFGVLAALFSCMFLFHIALGARALTKASTPFGAMPGGGWLWIVGGMREVSSGWGPRS